MLRLTPCPPGNANPESHEAQMSNAVGIGPDGEVYPLLSGTKSVDILQVKAVRHGVDLHDLTILGCGLEDGFQVYRYRLTLSYKAAGRVGNHVDIGVFYGGYYPAGHLFLALAHGRVNGRQSNIQFGQDFLGQVQPAVCPNINLDAREHPHSQ